MPSLASWGRFGGGSAVIAKIVASASSFTSNKSAGSFIASLSDPFANKGFGTTIFQTFGSVPAQVAVSGSTIVVGASAATVGNAYSVGVLAIAGDGSQAIGTKLAFTAISAPVALAALTLSKSSATAGTAYSATISGQTSGSTISASSSDGTALTVSGSTLTGTFAAAGTPTITLKETLATASNSPLSTNITITVTAVAQATGWTDNSTWADANTWSDAA